MVTWALTLTFFVFCLSRVFLIGNDYFLVNQRILQPWGPIRIWHAVAESNAGQLLWRRKLEVGREAAAKGAGSRAVVRLSALLLDAKL